MKIVVLSTDFLPQPGGIAVFVHNLCLQLRKRGHQVDVLTPARKGCVEADARQPYRVCRYISPPRLSSIVPIRRTLALHQQHHYDVVFIGHFVTTHALGVLVSHKLWGVPYVILSHGNDLHYSVSTKVDQWASRLLLENASLMLGNSRFTMKRIREASYAGPIEVLNPGVDVARFHPGVDTARVRHRYGLNGRRVLITTAQLVAKKNVSGVLHALPRVIEQVPDLLYLIVGNGKERERLETLCEKLQLHHWVRFLGHVENSQLPTLYCAAELFVMPSYDAGGNIETFGISFIEAHACGLPVIGGRSGGIVDAVIEGETGRLVDPYNTDEIAVAIVCLLNDQELARRLGENGRQRVEQELNWEKVGTRLDNFLQRVIEIS